MGVEGVVVVGKVQCALMSQSKNREEILTILKK